jgi:predicted transcriptional regulator
VQAYEWVMLMKKSLLDVLFASEKRKKTMLFLQDGPVEIEALLKSLQTT